MNKLEASQTIKRQPVVSDTLVNGGALKLALNVLRRTDKSEVADELEKTAVCIEVVKESTILASLNVAGQCRSTASHPISSSILVDGGGGLLKELLLDAAKCIENAYKDK